MARQLSRCYLLLAGGCLILTAVGCAKSTTRTSTLTSHTLCGGNLDECREIRLSYGVGREREGLGPERHYEQLTVKVSPREHLGFRRTVKTVELTFGVPRGQLRFRGVEGRIDEAGQKVWFVQRDTGRIVATFDAETHATTGPDDEPPAWATPDGGTPLQAGD